MNTQLRRKKIEEILHTEGFCNVTSLAQVLSVSEVTIRNDLSALEDEEKVTRVTVYPPDEHILHLNSKNTYEESHKVISTILPIITSAQHIVILGINDEFTLGTLAAFADAGVSERVIAIGQGTDQSEETKQRLDLSKLAEEMISIREYDTIPFSRSERNPSHRSLKTR